MNLRPLQDRIVVKPDDPEEVTKGGLYLPDTGQEKPNQGTVKAVGIGRRTEMTGDLLPMSVSEGDTVLYGKYSGAEIEVDGEKLLVMRENDVFAVVEKGEPADA